MANPQAFKGDYVDLKFIKTRKVAQVHIEIALEDAAQFVADFGAPNPASGIPIAMARIVATPAPEIKGGKLCQRAAILCGEGSFHQYLEERGYNIKTMDIPEKLAAAYVLRGLCGGITSRRELDHNNKAARNFLDLEASYKAWLTQ